MNVSELVARGIPAGLVEAWRASGITELTECQAEVLGDDACWTGEHLLVVAPTSSGKTLVGEVLAAAAAAKLERAIITVPYKAVAAEKYLELESRLRPAGIPVVISDGDHNDMDADIRTGHFGVAVVVYEKLLQLLVQNSGLLADCSLVVVDEIQMLGDRYRGPVLEMLLTHLLTLDDGPQLVGLSATLGDSAQLAEWMKARLFVCDKRPVPLYECVVSPAASSRPVDLESQATRDPFDLSAVPAPGGETREPLLTILRLLESEGDSTQALVFRARVDDTVSTAQRLAHTMNAAPVEPAVREAIGDLESGPVRTFLEQWIDKRVAYHNGGLSLEERRLVERLFRDGTIRVLVTTTTLAAGVNLPSDVVIVSDYERWDQEVRARRPIPVSEYKNCAGRAGRLGQGTEGRAYLVAEAEQRVPLLEAHYVSGTREAATSALLGFRNLDGLVLGIIARGLVPDSSRLAVFFEQTFASHLLDDAGRTQLAEAVVASGDRLIELGLIETVGSETTPTALGEVVARSGISVTSAERLVTVARELKSSEMSKELLAALLSCTELQGGLRPFDPLEKAQVLEAWLEGRDISEICTGMGLSSSVTNGHVRNLAGAAAWLLDCVAEMCAALELDEVLVTGLHSLAIEVRFGVEEAAIPLTTLGVLTRSEVLRLSSSALAQPALSLHSLLDATDDSYRGVLSPRRVAALKGAILDQAEANLATRRAKQVRRAEQFAGLRACVEEAYDRDGTDLESAIENLLESPRVGLDVTRFTEQRRGQPDLEFTGSQGTVVLQVTASENRRKPVSWEKAASVLQSVGYSGSASNFVTIARPSFHDVAIGNAQEIAARGERSLLLVTIPDLVELALQVAEGTLSMDGLVEILETSRGLLQFDNLGT